ncbi:DUF6777 domain-containing protein [Streptomyces sp. NPDC053086]|uniref:DUF6777 domain-containing protein n=1 Tax=unclassified Streptomyces TaxID=2593676 RepID=UPI0037D8D69E
MRIPTGTIVTVCVMSAVLLAAGCAGSGVKQARTGELVFLQAATDRGPEPFTASMATDVPGPASPRGTVPVSAAELAAPLRATRTLSGATPGLYHGTPHVAGCDVERHIGYLAADPAKADAFARVAGVTRPALPDYLRGLTPVVLGTDTRVTNHSYRNRRADGYQAVLQAGTAVLVDDRGVPRVRCACGNPLGPPAPTRGGAGARGTPWAGYRPNKVIVVAPAPRAVASLTIVDTETRTWTERRVGQDVRQDHVVSPPARAGADPSQPAPADTGPQGSGQPGAHESGPAAAPARTGTPSSPAGPTAPDVRTDPGRTDPGRTDPPAGVTGPADRDPLTPAEESPPPVPSPGLSGLSPGLSVPSPGLSAPSPGLSAPSPGLSAPSPEPSDRPLATPGATGPPTLPGTLARPDAEPGG